MAMSPATILLLLGGNVIALGLFLYSLGGLAAFRSRMAMRKVDAAVDKERARTRWLLEEHRQGSSIYVSPPAA